MALADASRVTNLDADPFAVVLAEFEPIIFKSARRTGELLGASVVAATI
jgi:hypothetical protein